MTDRRAFLQMAGAVSLLPAVSFTASNGATAMYGLIGKMVAKPGQRDALVAVLLEGVAGMPGCLSYVVAIDPTDADGIWITEVWDSQQSHRASLSLPAVQQAIARGKPMIASFAQSSETQPVGGHGLQKTA
jgi:quinol monooxygenase YgiN